MEEEEQTTRCEARKPGGCVNEMNQVRWHEKGKSQGIGKIRVTSRG